MAARLVLTPEKIESLHGQRPSARPAVAAQLLDTHVSVIYKLVQSGELEGHGLGQRGVRVYLDSIRSYQERNRLGKHSPSPQDRQKASKIKPWRGHAQKEAEAYLRDAGVL